MIKVEHFCTSNLNCFFLEKSPLERNIPRWVSLIDFSIHLSENCEWTNERDRYTINKRKDGIPHTVENI